MPAKELEPWKDDYWALTDPGGRVLAKLDIVGPRLATRSRDRRLREEVDFLNRHLQLPEWQGVPVEVFLGTYARSAENLEAPLQVRPILG